MKQVIKKYPRTKWADLAAYNLIDNKICGDWQGQTKCPEKETEIYLKYAEEHPQSPKTAEALYNAAWRQAALVSLYKSDNDTKKAFTASRPRRASISRRKVTRRSPARAYWAAGRRPRESVAGV